MCEDKETRPALNLDELEGLRGDGVAKWYVVHTYSGHEKKVKVNIEKLVESRGMQDLILDVVVPTEDRVEIKNGQRKIKTKKMFPGYVLINMIMNDDTWYVVRNTRGVTGFVGPESKAMPLTEEEVYNLGIEQRVIEVSYKVGDTVDIIDEMFEGTQGVVQEIDVDNDLVRVTISFFGRETSVELKLDQVEPVED